MISLFVFLEWYRHISTMTQVFFQHHPSSESPKSSKNPYRRSLFYEFMISFVSNFPIEHTDWCHSRFGSVRKKKDSRFPKGVSWQGQLISADELILKPAWSIQLEYPCTILYQWFAMVCHGLPPKNYKNYWHDPYFGSYGIGRTWYVDICCVVLKLALKPMFWWFCRFPFWRFTHLILLSLQISRNPRQISIWNRPNLPNLSQAFWDCELSFASELAFILSGFWAALVSTHKQPGCRWTAWTAVAATG